MLLKATSRRIRVAFHDERFGGDKADWYYLVELEFHAKMDVMEMFGAYDTVPFSRLIFELLNNLLFHCTPGRRSEMYSGSFEVDCAEISLSFSASVRLLWRNFLIKLWKPFHLSFALLRGILCVLLADPSLTGCLCRSRDET